MKGARTGEEAVFDPDRHHRRSIRLKRHDYGGGGWYFVTLCADREAGKVFWAKAVCEMVGRVWEALPERFPGVRVGCGGTHEGSPHYRDTLPYVVMPDHFHGLIQLKPGSTALGEVVGAFKSLVVREYVAGVKAGLWPATGGKIWHRNFYERYVRDAKEFQNTADYIRMNPWRLVFDLSTPVGAGFMPARWRGIGNPSLWEARKIAFLCSRNCPQENRREASVWTGSVSASMTVVSGFHSPVEKEVLGELLKGAGNLVYVPACAVESLHVGAEWLVAMEAGRVLIASPFEEAEMTNGLALARNRLVLALADDRIVPYAATGGNLWRMLGTGKRLE